MLWSVRIYRTYEKNKVLSHQEECWPSNKYAQGSKLAAGCWEKVCYQLEYFFWQKRGQEHVSASSPITNVLTQLSAQSEKLKLWISSKNNVIKGRIVHCCKENKNNHVCASRHANECQLGFGRKRATTCGTVCWGDGKSEQRNVQGQTAQPELCCCTPCPCPLNATGHLEGTRRKQPSSHSAWQGQRKVRMSRAGAGHTSAATAPDLQLCSCDTAHPWAKTLERLLEGLGHGENPDIVKRACITRVTRE